MLHGPERRRKSDQIAFMMAATWPTPSSAEIITPTAPLTANARRGPSFAEHRLRRPLMHKYWHFVNGLSRPMARRCAIGDAQCPTTDRRVAAVVGSECSDDVKSRISSGCCTSSATFTSRCVRHTPSSFPDGDAGGTRVKIQCGEGCDATDLHAF
jgi:hypothetical protein